MSARTMFAVCAIVLVAACATALATVAAPANESQVSGIIKRASGALTDEIGRKVEQLLRDGVRCVVGDLDCVRKAKEQGKPAVMTDANGAVLTDDKGVPITDPNVAARKAGAPPKPGEGAWANYDFVPGDRVLFAEDFTADRVGNFPRRLELVAGNWEIVEWQGGRYFRATSGGTIGIPLPEVLPDKFTVEFAASVSHGNASVQLTTGELDHGKRDYAGSVPSYEYSQAGLRAARGQGPQTLARLQGGSADAFKALGMVRIMADGSYMKMYVNEQRVANAPNAVFPRGKTLYLTAAWAEVDSPILIGPIRVGAGGVDLYDAIEKHGRVATQGIYFATNSAVIRPESTETLRQIGEMLRTHAALRLSIEGHTDSDGDDVYNLDLSARRAAAVKTFLVGTFGIESGRLETVGRGESTPAAANETPEGRQQNRRVELVRLGGRPR